MSDLVNGRYPVKNPEFLLQGQATQAGNAAVAVRSNIPRYAAGSDLAALTTAVATSVALPLAAGDVVTNLSFKSGATAAGTPTHWFFALYDPNGNLLAQTADQTATAWAADTTKTLPLTTAITVATPGVYYATCVVVASATPTLVGVTLGRAAVSTGVLTGDLPLARTHGSGLTTTAPATITGATAVATVPYVVAS